MVVIIYGFPNKVSALHFEWAWQNPNQSRLVKQSGLTFPKSNGTKQKLQVLFGLLSILPWVNFPLKLNLLDFPEDLKCILNPPKHIDVTHHPLCFFKQSVDPSKNFNLNEMFNIKDYKTVQVIRLSDETKLKCFHCQTEDGLVLEMQLTYCPQCNSIVHVFCLATFLLATSSDNKIIPWNSECTHCKAKTLWSKLVDNSSISDYLKEKIVETGYLMDNEEEVINLSFSKDDSILKIDIKSIEQTDLNVSVEKLNLHERMSTTDDDSEFGFDAKLSLRDRLDSQIEFK